MKIEELKKYDINKMKEIDKIIFIEEWNRAIVGDYYKGIKGFFRLLFNKEPDNLIGITFTTKKNKSKRRFK